MRLRLTFKYLLFTALLFMLLTGVGYLSTLALLKIDMHSDIDSSIQVFWSADKEGFSEASSKKSVAQKGWHVYWFLVDGVNNGSRFRIDPVTQEAHIKLYNVELYSLFYDPVKVDIFNDPLQSSGISFTDTQTSYPEFIELTSLGIDPQFEIRPILSKNSTIFYVAFSCIFAFFFRKTTFVYTILLCVGSILFYSLFSLNETRLTFQAEVSQVETGQIKVFWRDGNEQFSSARSRLVTIDPKQKLYAVPIDNINNIEEIAISVGKFGPAIAINNLSLTEPGLHTFNFQPIYLSSLNACQTDAASINDYNDVSCRYQSGIHKQGSWRGLLINAALFVAVYALLLWMVYCCLQNRRYQLQLLPTLYQTIFFIALLLVVQLSWQADINIHPDELAHIEATKYYSRYWQPPTVGDSRALGAYQYPWSISRLDDLGISYFFAGKFAHLLDYLYTDMTFIYRAFSVVLFLTLFIASGVNKRLLLFLTPLLCTPQIWYLFAYANRGSFVLFVSILLAWQLANKKSALHGFLNADKVFSGWKKALYPGLLLGILSIEQTNYYLFILYVLSVLLWQLLFFVQQKKVFLYQCLLFMAIGASVFLIRYAADVSINGFDKKQQRVAYAEQHAAPKFKPSYAENQDSYVGLRLKSKGVSFSELFQKPWDWHNMSFKSFSGFYGYYAEYSPRWYYAYVLILYAMVLLVLLRQAIFSAHWKYQLFSLLSFTAVAGGLLSSILYSWLHDFQPQGRYIFPVIPIILVYFWSVFPQWNRQEKAILLSCVLALMLLSLYSFNEVALNYLVA